MMADRRPYGLVLPPNDEITSYPSVFGTIEQWKTLARSLAANVPTATSGPATVVLRSDSPPTLALLGWATPKEHDALEAALDLFVGSLSRLRPVDYSQVEDDCRALAVRLRECLSADFLDDAVFTGIPRGGTIVEGMLSYALDLSPKQLDPQARPEAPLVVVDDCFLTGHRAGRFVDDRPDRSDVVLAGLYAHPDLRNALEAEIPSVRACVTARDLTDHAPDLYGDDYADWKARWASRDTGPRYWIGVPDHLCFPWSEPDVGFWNPSTDSLTQGWRVAPPGHCLDRRDEDTSVPIFVQESSPAESGERALSPGPDVFYAEVGDRTMVVHASSETCLALEDPAADFWWALVEHETASDARNALQSRYDVDPAVLESDLQEFVETAVERRLLVGPRPSSSS
jgi:hypothetical protein